MTTRVESKDRQHIVRSKRFRGRVCVRLVVSLSQSLLQVTEQTTTMSSLLLFPLKLLLITIDLLVRILLSGEVELSDTANLPTCRIHSC